MLPTCIIKSRGRIVLATAFGLLIGFAALSVLYDANTLNSHIFRPTKSLRQKNFRWMIYVNYSASYLTVCKNETCRQMYSKQLQHPDVFPIPKIRHVLWRDESVPSYFARHLRTWHSIHPDWTFVLWRDRDLEPFVARNFPSLLNKFKFLGAHIMRVDMIRFMLLTKFGGTYADLDYSLVRSLDSFRRFHAVVTQEPEAHSLQHACLEWPIKPLINTAFLMTAPGHKFLRFVLDELAVRDSWVHPLEFSGPFGLTRILAEYEAEKPFTNDPLETLYIPPSHSFYPYEKNSLKNTSPDLLRLRKSMLNTCCRMIGTGDSPAAKRLRQVKNLTRLCADVTNFDPITDSSPPVFAVHDVRKSGPSWDEKGAQRPEYQVKLQSMSQVVPNLKIGADFDSQFPPYAYVN